MLFGLVLLPQAGAAQENLFLEVQTGFDAFYKIDAWTPIRVTIANQGNDLQAEIRVRDDSAGFSASNILYVYPVDLPAQSRRQFTLHAPLRGQRQLLVEVVDGDGALLASTIDQIEPLKPTAFLVGVVAGDLSLLNELAGLLTDDGERVAVAHLNPDDLPAIPQAWVGLDVLVFNDVDTTLLTAAQQDLLHHWVNSGGRLVVGGGPNALQTIAGLKPLLPFANLTIQTLAHPLDEFQKFAKTSLADRGPYVAALPANVAGHVIVTEEGLPLIVSLEHGLGQVYYLAFDLGLAPLDLLAGKPQFFPRLIGQLQPQAEYLTRRAGWGDMQNSLALISDQTLPTPGVVTIYLCLYILAMGPLNYFVLRRLKRREWGWFTIPTIILLFSGYGYFSGFRLRGGEPLVRQISVTQATVGGPLASVISFVGVYSPYRADYTLQFDQPALIESLPNSYGVTNELTVINRDSTVVENLRGDIGGMPAIIAHSQTTAPQITTNLSYDKTSRRFRGVIINNTGRPLNRASLVLIEANSKTSSGSTGDESNRYQVAHLGTLSAGETAVDTVAVQRSVYDLFYEQDYLNNNPELELVSRDLAIRTILGLSHNYSSQPERRLTTLHLTGWQSGSPLNVTLANRPGDHKNETLLLMNLPLIVN